MIGILPFASSAVALLDGDAGEHAERQQPVARLVHFLRRIGLAGLQPGHIGGEARIHRLRAADRGRRRIRRPARPRRRASRRASASHGRRRSRCRSRRPAAGLPAAAGARSPPRAFSTASERASPPGTRPNSAGSRSAASPRSAIAPSVNTMPGSIATVTGIGPSPNSASGGKSSSAPAGDRDVDHAVIARLRIERRHQPFAVGARLGQQPQRAGNRPLRILYQRRRLVQRLRQFLVAALDGQRHRVVQRVDDILVFTRGLEELPAEYLEGICRRYQERGHRRTQHGRQQETPGASR